MRNHTYTYTSYEEFGPQMNSISEGYVAFPQANEVQVFIFIFLCYIHIYMCTYVYTCIKKLLLFLGESNKKNEYSDLTGLVST